MGILSGSPGAVEVPGGAGGEEIGAESHWGR